MALITTRKNVLHLLCDQPRFIGLGDMAKISYHILTLSGSILYLLIIKMLNIHDPRVVHTNISDLKWVFLHSDGFILFNQTIFQHYHKYVSIIIKMSALS